MALSAKTALLGAFIFYFAGCSRNANFRVEGKEGFGPGEQDWGYITVRPQAHMFWWLLYTTAEVLHYTDRPLIIWLQGGPGVASSGYGYFLEIGPVNLDLEIRNDTWVKDFNVLIIDNPVGVGFSYFSSNESRMATNNAETGRDLVAFTKVFLEMFQEFQTVPLYIFGESYGGKMAVDYSLQLYKEIRQGNLRANLLGIGLGDAYISPLDYILNYAPFALNLGLTDRLGFEKLENLARTVRESIMSGEYHRATEIEAHITASIQDVTQGVDIYNIAFKANFTSTPHFLSRLDTYTELLNGPVKAALNIPEHVTWAFFNDTVYSALQNDLIRSVTPSVEELLNTTDIRVIVYNGVFDFIVNTPGTVNWLHNLNWYNASVWRNTAQEVVEVNGVTEAYVKSVDDLVFYTVLRAGHSVPIDNTQAMWEILRRELLHH